MALRVQSIGDFGIHPLGNSAGLLDGYLGEPADSNTLGATLHAAVDVERLGTVGGDGDGQSGHLQVVDVVPSCCRRR